MNISFDIIPNESSQNKKYKYILAHMWHSHSFCYTNMLSPTFFARRYGYDVHLKKYKAKFQDCYIVFVNPEEGKKFIEEIVIPKEILLKLGR